MSISRIHSLNIKNKSSITSMTSEKSYNKSLRSLPPRTSGIRQKEHEHDSTISASNKDNKYLKNVVVKKSDLFDLIDEAIDYEMMDFFIKIEKSLKELKNIVWVGGKVCQNHFTDSELFINLYQATLLESLKWEIVQFIGILCRDNRDNQDLAYQTRWVEALFELLYNDNELLRKWAATSLFYVLLNHAENQNIILSIPNFQKTLFEVSNESWKDWDYNDAEEILKMLSE